MKYTCVKLYKLLNVSVSDYEILSWGYLSIHKIINNSETVTGSLVNKEIRVIILKTIIEAGLMADDYIRYITYWISSILYSLNIYVLLMFLIYEHLYFITRIYHDNEVIELSSSNAL